MALTDDEKLRMIKNIFNVKINSIATLAAMKTFITNVTKAQVKTFIKNKIIAHADAQRNHAADTTAIAGEMDNLSTEVDNI